MQIFTSQPVVVKVDGGFTLQIGNGIRDDDNVQVFGNLIQQGLKLGVGFLLTWNN